jgi:hypothetical protein
MNTTDKMAEALPPLPPPHWPRYYQGSVPPGAYTADQMQAYARAALEAEAKPAEPVAWINDDMDIEFSHKSWMSDVWKPLYAAPAAPAPDHIVDANKLVAPLRSVHLTRDTRGMCVVSLNGFEVIRDNGDVIDHMATPSLLSTYAAPAAPAEPEQVAKWRDLAIKFDRQRMAALSHLRMLLAHGDAHAEAVRKFLAEPPGAAPAAPAPWVPVSERLPGERTLCLVMLGEQMHVAQFDPLLRSAKWWNAYGLPSRLAQEPTHWMPLPAPPEAGKGGGNA